jgi:capsular polysaccharide transport system permease protein
MNILKSLGSFVFKFTFKFIFIVLFLVISYYILYVETEKYQSQSIIMIKDISQEQSVSPLGALLSTGSSESVRDAKLLDVYMQSSDMYKVLDKEFNLSQYYASDTIDPFHRLSNSITLPWIGIEMTFPFMEEVNQNFLRQYQNDLHILYTEESATLSIGFTHADAKIAKKIVRSIIKHASKKLNEFEKENTKIVLSFLKKQEREKYQIFMDTLKELLVYQSKYHTLDPQIDINAKSTILAGLESELVQKEVEYNGKSQYLNLSSTEMQLLSGNIAFIKKSITKIKNQITGKTGSQKLNVNMSNFELLKSKVDFNKELYRQTLIKLEETKILIQQNKKNLIVVSHADVADRYSSPNKIKDIFSIFMIIGFLYAVITLILTIIRDHKD